jgi:hypothetical protein
VFLLEVAKYPISICYLEEDPISGQNRSDCGETISDWEESREFCYLYTAKR